MIAWPYVTPPTPPKAKLPKTLPPELYGFTTTHLSCLQCGVRIDLDLDDKAQFLVEHMAHIRAFLESGR